MLDLINQSRYGAKHIKIRFDFITAHRLGFFGFFFCFFVLVFYKYSQQWLNTGRNTVPGTYKLTATATCGWLITTGKELCYIHSEEKFCLPSAITRWKWWWKWRHVTASIVSNWLPPKNHLYIRRNEKVPENQITWWFSCGLVTITIWNYSGLIVMSSYWAIRSQNISATSSTFTGPL